MHTKLLESRRNLVRLGIVMGFADSSALAPQIDVEVVVLDAVPGRIREPNPYKQTTALNASAVAQEINTYMSIVRHVEPDHFILRVE